MILTKGYIFDKAYGVLTKSTDNGSTNKTEELL